MPLRGGTPARFRTLPVSERETSSRAFLYGARGFARAMAIPLTALPPPEQPTRATIRRRIKFLNEKPCVAPIRLCSRWGLPCRSCCPCAVRLRTVSPLPRRFVSCGASLVALPEVIRHRVPWARLFHCESGGHPAGWPDRHRRPEPFRQLSNWQRPRGTNAVPV